MGVMHTEEVVPLLNPRVTSASASTASWTRTFLLAGLAVSCLLLTLGTLNAVSFEPGSNGLWSVLGWSSYGLDEELVPSSVTLVAACSLVDERIPAFQTAIQSWVEASKDGPAGKRAFDRVIIVDWSSQANLWQQVLNFWTVDTPLEYYRVDDPDGNAADWVLAKAFNFGMSRVKTDTILKVDCDTYVSNGLLGLNPVADKAGEIKAFRYGDYRAAADENEIHINGCVLAKKAVLEGVNFYDERLQQYGWDDTNFYDRLTAAGTMALNITRRNALGKTLITHVWHPHSELSQDGRVSSSCENRCAINRLERQRPWALQERSEYWKVSDMPNNGNTGGEYITFAKYQGGDLPSVQETLGGEIGQLLKTYCQNAKYAAGKCYAGTDWVTGYNPEEELASDDDVRWATEQLQRL